MANRVELYFFNNYVLVYVIQDTDNNSQVKSYAIDLTADNYQKATIDVIDKMNASEYAPFAMMNIPIEPVFIGVSRSKFNKRAEVYQYFRDNLKFKPAESSGNIEFKLYNEDADKVRAIDGFLCYLTDITNTPISLPHSESREEWYKIKDLADDISVYVDNVENNSRITHSIIFNLRFIDNNSDDILCRANIRMYNYTTIAVTLNHAYSELTDIYFGDIFKYMDECKKLYDKTVEEHNLRSEQYDEYSDYIAKHIANVQAVFDEYGRDLCRAVGADYFVTADEIKYHDSSKTDDEEFDAYANKFYPIEGMEYDKEKVEHDFTMAWLHHIHMNPHHPEHYVYYYPGDKQVIGEMPPEQIVCMLCDWQSFAKIGKGGAYEYYYTKDKKEGLLNPNTRVLVERGLEVLK